MIQGGGKSLSTDKLVAATGTDVTVTGPPGETVIVQRNADPSSAKQVQLDSSGKATVKMPSQPGLVTMILASDFSKSLILTVIDAMKS